MRNISIAMLVLVTLLAGSAETVTVVGTHQKKECHLKAGDMVQVAGSHNDVSVEGKGVEVMVSGSHNDVYLDAAIDRLVVVGSYNTVIVEVRAGRPRPKVTKTGKHNEINFEEVNGK